MFYQIHADMGPQRSAGDQCLDRSVLTNSPLHAHARMAYISARAKLSIVEKAPMIVHLPNGLCYQSLNRSVHLPLRRSLNPSINRQETSSIARAQEHAVLIRSNDVKSPRKVEQGFRSYQ